MRPYITAILGAVAVLVFVSGSGGATMAQADDKATETFRVEVLGPAPPGQAFVAVYSHHVGDSRLPGLKSPPSGGGYNIFTWVVLCGSVTKRDYQNDQSEFTGGFDGRWHVRQVFGNGERECRGDGSVYSRTITIPPRQGHSFHFLRVANREIEPFVEERKDQNYTTGGTRTAYYDFRIGAGRVGGRPGLKDRRFQADIAIELRGRASSNIWGQRFIKGELWENICFQPGSKPRKGARPPRFKLSRCAGEIRTAVIERTEGFPPGTRLTYSVITDAVRDDAYAPSYSDCAPGPRKLVCAGVTLDSDVSVNIWYDFDRGEGGSRIIRHPYKMPSAGGGGSGGARAVGEMPDWMPSTGGGGTAQR